MTLTRALRATLAVFAMLGTGAVQAVTYSYDFDDLSGDPSAANLAGVDFVTGDSGATFGQNYWIKFGDFYTYMSQYALDMPYSNTTLTLEFDSPASNLSFDLGHTDGGPIQSLVPGGAVATVELFSSGCSGEFCWVTQGPSFGGEDELRFQYPEGGVTSVRISYNFGATGTLGMDNLSFTVADGPGPVIPEPSTYALLLGGLGALAWGVRRRPNVSL